MKINYDELWDYNDIKIAEDITKVDEIIEYEEILFEISKSIINYRKENNLTQTQLAEILEVDQVMISKLERGNYNPTFKLLHKISRKLTGNANFFVNILNNIVENINEMYEMDYNVSVVKIKFTNSNSNNVLYMDNYNFKELQGGIYDTEKCTSPISIAG